jgi:mannan endo-1,4-beta-mannosidase
MKYGSTSLRSGNIFDVKNKTDWLNQFCDYININPIKMASYFNIEKETDWMILDGTHGDVVWNNYYA